MIVIGAGSGGLSMGLGLHELGFKVLLVDKKEESIGGECLNKGCVPSKAFIHISKKIANARTSQKFGLNTVGRVSLPAIWDYVKDAQEKIRAHENSSYYQAKGLDVVIGEAKFNSARSVTVAGKEYFGKKLTIATGSQPRKLQVPGIDLVEYYDSDNIWDLTELPQRMLFVGAGPISMELGQAFARLGSEVTMVEVMEVILGHEDPEIAQIAFIQSQELGIRFHLNTQLIEFTDPHRAILQQGSQQWTEEFDVVVVGIGRQRDFSSLNLPAAGIRTDDSGEIVLDAYLRTTNKNIYVLGDAANQMNFSHAAEHQATTLISNFFSPFKKKVTYDQFSWVTFTDPEIATFGLGQSQLKARGIKYEKLILPLHEDDRAVTSDYQYGKIILFVKPGWTPFSDAKILGGSLIAPQAGEMCQELILAQSAGLGIRSFFNKTYPYPTASRANKTLVINRYLGVLRPWMIRIMKLIY